jgi:protein gp37
MGEATSIAWTDHTFNPWWGCARVSPGCENCYAEAFAKRTGNAVWGVNAPRRFFGLKHWTDPRNWNEKALREGRRARVFCASMADVFERLDGEVGATLDAERGHLWTTIEQTPALDWLLLTKRPENVAAMLPPAWLHIPRRNVWLGVTAEDQKRADQRVPILRALPAVVRFVSVEPQIGHVEFFNTPLPDDTGPFGPGWRLDPVRTETDYGTEHDIDPQIGIDWVIVGGESGPGARPFDLAWARSLVAECRDNGVACFVKQLGAWPVDGVAPTGRVRINPDTGKRQVELAGTRLKLKDHKGGDPDEWPADLRVREFPEVHA